MYRFPVLSAACCLLGAAMTVLSPIAPATEPAAHPDHGDHTHSDPHAHAHDAATEADRRIGPFTIVEYGATGQFAAGMSTATDAELGELQGGAHDPRETGLSFQQVELSLGAWVEHVVWAELHLVASEHDVELEEAFGQIQSLARGLELEVGYFFTEFGLQNPRHPHDWDFLDQPLVSSRVFGGEGMRGAGLRLGWYLPLAWDSELHLGVQRADGDYMYSFAGGAGHSHGDDDDEPEESHHHAATVGGRPAVDRSTDGLEDLVYLGRWQNGWQVTDSWRLQLGVSGLVGPNNTGADGYTLVYGGDVLLQWQPAGARDGAPVVTWSTEVIGRSYHADAFVEQEEEDGEEPEDEAAHTLAAATLDDWGIYSQVVWGWHPDWAMGLRGEYAGGSGPGFDDGEAVSRASDPLRGDRTRVSPLLIWRPTAYSRLRLQYNYDRADFLEDGDAHSLWLGLELHLGPHAGHGH